MVGVSPLTQLSNTFVNFCLSKFNFHFASLILCQVVGREEQKVLVDVFAKKGKDYLSSFSAACSFQPQLNLACTLQVCLGKETVEKQEGKQEHSTAN